MSEVTDRELLIRFEGKLDVFDTRLDALNTSIKEFTNKVSHLEDNKMAGMNKRLVDLESWKSRMAGAWIVILFLGGIITAGIIGLIKYFMK